MPNTSALQRKRKVQKKKKMTEKKVTSQKFERKEEAHFDLSAAFQDGMNNYIYDIGKMSIRNPHKRFKNIWVLLFVFFKFFLVSHV